MAIKYSDSDITALLGERKPLPPDFRSKIRLREKLGHKEQELDVQGVDGNQFKLILRQSSFNMLDFSVILAYCPEGSNLIFRLRRYNGKSHEHSNQIENTKFYDFHIHTATERYQELGMREDTYAEPSQSFADFNSAVNIMVRDCNFELPENPQGNLFEELT